MACICNRREAGWCFPSSIALPTAKLLDQWGWGRNRVQRDGTDLYELFWNCELLWPISSKIGLSFVSFLIFFQLLQPFLHKTMIKCLLEHFGKMTCNLTWSFTCLLCPIKCLRKLPELPSKSPWKKDQAPRCTYMNIEQSQICHACITPCILFISLWNSNESRHHTLALSPGQISLRQTTVTDSPRSH